MRSLLCVLVVLLEAAPVLAEEPPRLVELRVIGARPGTLLRRATRVRPSSPDPSSDGIFETVCVAPCTRPILLQPSDVFFTEAGGSAPSLPFTLGQPLRAVDLVVPAVPDSGYRAGLLVTALGIVATSIGLTLLALDPTPPSRASAPTYAAAGAGFVALTAGLSIVMTEHVTVAVVPRP